MCFILTDDTSTSSCVAKFLEDYREHEPILLVDLSMWTQSDHLDELAKVLGNCDLRGKTTAVVAHSSGCVSFCNETKLSSSLKVQLQNLELSKHVEYKPFTEQEAEVFMDAYREELHTTMRELKPLTNYNPSLLAVCFHKDLLNATASVQKYVRDYSSEGLKRSLTVDWVAADGNFSMELLYFAANSIELSQELKPQYIISWVASQGITYISHEDANHFVLALNFPLILSYLMEMLATRSATNNTTYNDLIRGYRFEHALLDSLNELVLVYNNQEDMIRRTANFKFTARVQCRSGQALTRMEEGILYHLRAKHPVIDAAARVNDGNGKKWLLLLQVSLSPYKEHMSKAADLKNHVTGPERDYQDCTWLEYYCRISQSVPPAGQEEARSCMYVYISPKEYASETNPSDTLGDVGIRSRTKELFLGLVLDGTPTHDCINKAMSSTSLY